MDAPRKLPTGTLTFVFTDIEASTRLLHRLGSAYASTLEQHHRILRNAFARHEGIELATEGDSFFVVFERVLDAVRAALDAQIGLAEHAWPTGAAVKVRMGMHTGQAALTPDGYVGMVIHEAARISAAGHGGQVLLSESTEALVKDELPREASLRDLGRHQLKDLAHAERIFQLFHPALSADFPPLRSDAALPDNLALMGRGVFVARDSEMAELISSLNDVWSGRGRLFLIAGEPGIGKSRLTDEFASKARERGVRVLWGQCWEAGGAPSYWPWIQSIRAYIQRKDRETLGREMYPGASDISQILPEVRELFPDLPPTSSSNDPEGARFRLFDSTAAFLKRASEDQPLLFVLDDLHAADMPSLLLLQFIAREMAESHLLIVGAYRDTDIGSDHPLASTLAETSRQKVTRRLTLRGLDHADVGRLIEATSGVTPPEGLISTLQSETEGNPLFIGELVRLLASEGRLETAGEISTRAIPLPASVRQVIGRRLEYLSDECRSILTLASILGREFGLDALERISEVAGDSLLDLLDEAAAARVVTEVPGTIGNFRFSHALIRDVLYDEMTPTRRVRRHRQAAQELEALHGRNLEPHLAEIAYHFFEGMLSGDAAKAVEYARSAGDRAIDLLGYEEAARLYKMALKALRVGGSPDDSTRCDLLLVLGDAYARAGDLRTSQETFLEAAETARKFGTPRHLAGAALGYGGRFVWEAARGDTHLLPLLEEALQVQGEEESALRIKLMARLAGGPLRNDPIRERRAEMSLQAVEMARHIGQPELLAYALDGRYAAVWWPENIEERLAIAKELIETSELAGEKERAAQGHHYRCLARLEVGDMPGVYEDLDAEIRLAEELGQPAQLGHVGTDRATLANFEGRFEEAAQLIDQAVRLAERAQGSMAGVYFTLQSYMVSLEQGRLETMEERVKRAIQVFPKYSVLRCLLAHLYSELRREEQARRSFESLADEEFSDLARDEEWVFGMCLLSEVAGFLSDTRRAASLYELLLPYVERNAVSAPDACIGSVARNLGILAAMRSRWEEAARHFDDALKMNTKTGARPWVAHTQHDYARMLLVRDAPGDRERALHLVTQARETCRELGMVSLGAKLSTLLV